MAATAYCLRSTTKTFPERVLISLTGAYNIPHPAQAAISVSPSPSWQKKDRKKGIKMPLANHRPASL